MCYPVCVVVMESFGLQAFRHMSHKFHGKSSGKKKTDKRIKRMKEEMVFDAFHFIIISLSPPPLSLSL